MDKKRRSCLDSTPRIKEKQDKEERVIVTVDSLEEAKSIEDFRKMAIKKCNFNREVKKKKKRFPENWQLFKEATTRALSKSISTLAAILPLHVSSPDCGIALQ